MAGNDKTFWIRIKSVFGRAGADEAAGALKETGDAATEAAEAVREVGDSATEAAEAVREVGDAGATAGTEAGAGVQEAAEGLREVADSAEEATAAVEQVGDAGADAGGKAESGGLGGFFEKTKGQLGEIGEKIPVFGKMGGAIAALATGPIGLLIGAFAVLTAAITKSIAAVAEFSTHQVGVLRMNAALAAGGNHSRSFSIEVQKLASEMQKLTGIGDTQWIDSMRQLLQFGANPRNLREHVKAVGDLAGLVGDVNTATLLYSRALQGQFEMLSRYRIELERTGDKVKDLENFQRILAERGGGQLQASVAGNTGAFKDFGNTVSDVMKGFGNLLSRNQAIAGSFRLMTKALEGLVALLPNVTEHVGELENKYRSAAEQIDEVRRNTEELSKTKLEEAIAQAEALRDAMNAAADAATRARQRQDELTDARTGATLARLDEEEAQTLREFGGDDSEKRAAISRDFAARRQAVREAAAEEKRERERAALEEQRRREDVTRQAAEAGRSGAGVREAEIEVATSQNVLRRIQAERERLSQEQAGLGDSDPRRQEIERLLNQLGGDEEIARQRLEADSAALAEASAQYERHAETARAAAAAVEELDHKLKLLTIRAGGEASSGAAETTAREDAADQSVRARAQREAEEAERRRLEAEAAEARNRLRSGAGRVADDAAGFSPAGRQANETDRQAALRQERQRQSASDVVSAARTFAETGEGEDAMAEAMREMAASLQSTSRGMAENTRQRQASFEALRATVQRLEEEVRRMR